MPDHTLPTPRRADVVDQLRRELDQRLAEGHRFVRIGEVLRMLGTIERAKALRRLDAGEDATAISADLGVTAAQIHRWDDDPSIDAYRDQMAEVMLS